jgi:hypothetical protein
MAGLMRLASFMAALAFALAPAGRVAAADAPPAWLGVTFDTPAAALRPVLGDPLLVTRLPEALAAAGLPVAPDMVPERKARYVLGLRPPVFLIVSERHGNVVGIEAESERALSGPVADVPADPNGVQLGITEDELVRLRPGVKKSSSTAGYYEATGPRYVASYALAQGRVRAIMWFALPKTDPPGDGPALAEPTGDDAAGAILDVRPNETDGILWERLWAYYHPCAKNTQWVKGRVATSHINGRTYDAVTSTCPATGASRTVWFDITAFYGKL